MINLNQVGPPSLDSEEENLRRKDFGKEEEFKAGRD